MEYNELIRRKNRILAIILFVCIAMRGVVNAFFISIGQTVVYVVGGLVLTLILLLLVKKVHPVVMMYALVLLISAICYVIMIAFPCTTNYMMFYLAIFFVVIYEDIRPIVMQAVICSIGMVFFYFKYQQKLAETWSMDAMCMCIVYLVSGMLVFIFLSRLTKEQFNNLQEESRKSQQQTEKAEMLLGEIGRSVNELGSSNEKINSSVSVSGDISNQIAIAAEDVAKRAAMEVDETQKIQESMESGVEQVRDVRASSLQMADFSKESGTQIEAGAKKMDALISEMSNLNTKMDEISHSISALSDENARIVDILATLDEITSQTNLLSLNASIEAARAGEQGKGFAVVATEIRNLSENSAKFTEEIHAILDGINSQTKSVRTEITRGQELVENCNGNANEVNGFFEIIQDNTKQVQELATDINQKSRHLDHVLTQTLDATNAINEDLSSTSSAMEEITASIHDLNGNIDTVVEGYNDINQITGELVEVSAAKDEEDGEFEFETSRLAARIKERRNRRK